MKTIFKSKRGAALATVLIVFAVVAIVGTTIVTTSLAQVQSSVAVEGTTTAYYLARSAVEIVTSKIEVENKKVEDAEAVLLALKTKAEEAENDEDKPTEAEVKAAKEAYQKAQAYFNSLQLIPATADAPPCSVTLSGVGPKDIVVYIDRDLNDVIEVTCTAKYKGKSSSASAQIGNFSTGKISIEYKISSPYNPSWLGDDAMYSWGNIKITGNFTLYNYAADQIGKISASRDITLAISDDKTPGGTRKYEDVYHDLPIIVPPSLPDKNISSIIGKNKTVKLTSANNGYYQTNGLLIDKTTWEITSSEDVLLIFDKFYAKALDVTFTGSGSLYIYIEEDYTYPGATTKQNLMTLSNQVNISGSQDGKVRTYFIVYNDLLKAYYEKHEKDDNFNETLIPYGEVISELPDDKLDTINIANNSHAYAHFYAPGCSLTDDNKLNVYGSFYARDINVNNKTHFHYVPFDSKDLFKNAGVPPGGDIITVQEAEYDTKKLDYKRVWTRY